MITISDELKIELKTILSTLEKRDQSVRDRHLRLLKMLDLYWKNIHNIFWDAAVKDWRNINDQNINTDLDTYYADKVINIYRAHGESIIAALSQDLPQTIFVPDDAENQDDLNTARVWTQISELINKEQKAVLLLIRTLFLMYNQGTVAAYVYSKADEDNGMYNVPQYGRRTQYTDNEICPNCGADLASAIRPEEMGMEPTMPGSVLCEYCQQEVIPFIETDEEEVPVILGYKQEPKPRPCIEIYGMMNIRVPHFVKTQKECGYLILETDSDKEYAQDEAGEEIPNNGNGYETGRWARLDSDFDWEESNQIVTWRRVWLRSWEFNLASSPERAKELKKKFPKGCYFLMMNDLLVEADNESMDAHWIISQSPLSNHIHTEPLGLPAKAVQDIRSEIVILQLQAMEYGIPDTFADPAVLDFKAYGKSEAAPGQIFPIKAMPAGRALGDSFATLKTAIYPKEAEEFKKSLDQDGQFVLGDFPSIYGGVQQGGSRTLGEYQSSQSRALMRLSIVWKITSVFWAGINEKATRIFVNEMREDEKFVKKSGSNWVNIWIRRSNMLGKIGSVEPETNTAFPMSFMQKKDSLLKLIEFQNPAIQTVITHPENAGLIAKYMGFPELYIPGDDDRNKQLDEIQEIMEGIPVEIDADLDVHQTEYDACIAWLNSDYGIDAKMSNPEGREMVKEHARQHKIAISMLQMQQMEQEAQFSDEVEDNEQFA